MHFFHFEIFLVSIGAAVVSIIALLSGRRLRSEIHRLDNQNSSLQRELAELRS